MKYKLHSSSTCCIQLCSQGKNGHFFRFFIFVASHASSMLHRLWYVVSWLLHTHAIFPRLMIYFYIVLPTRPAQNHKIYNEILLNHLLPSVCAAYLCLAKLSVYWDRYFSLLLLVHRAWKRERFPSRVFLLLLHFWCQLFDARFSILVNWQLRYAKYRSER